MISPGAVVDGKYEILSLIGKGGMSRVWLARDLRLNKLWAAKEILGPQGSEGVEGRDSLREARLLRDLDHPALPRVVDIVDDEDATLVVMDYVEGESLDRVLGRRGGRLGQDEVVSIGLDLCDVLDYLHTRVPPVIYRDMKPSNVMLTPQGDVKLVDFGIARRMREDTTADTQVLGTRGYAAPEQFSRLAQSDARTDVYGLGMTLYRLVTGIDPSEDPFEVRPIGEVDPTLSQGLDSVIRRATQQDPSRRYQSAAEMGLDLAHHGELTEGFRAEQRRVLARFVALAVLSMALLVVGMGCLLLRVRMGDEAFEQALSMARASSVSSPGGEASPAERALVEAIEMRPRSTEPYELLVGEVYEADGAFTADEEGRWRSLFWTHGAGLSEQSGYARLCYDVGMLYLVYCDYGDEESRGSEAVAWFASAASAYQDRTEHGLACTLDPEGYRAAQVLETVSGFCSALARSRAAGTEAKVYEEYWQALSCAVDLEELDNAPMVTLRLYQLAVRAIASPEYLMGFARAGVVEGDATALLDHVGNRLAAGAGQASRDAHLTSLLEEVEETMASAGENIARVYGEDGRAWT